MKLEEIRDDYYEATAKVSELSRQLAFAGLAVIWIVRPSSEGIDISELRGLLVPLSLFVVSLGLDFLQYLYKYAFLGYLNRKNWQLHQDISAEIEFSRFWNYTTSVLFLGKVLFIVIGYLLLARYIFTLFAEPI